MNRRTLALVAVCALLIVGGYLLLRPSPSTTSPSFPSATRVEATTARSGMPTCPLAALPPEVADTVDDIRSGGPFPFPRNDGVVFGNREAHLPDATRGYYHEYTVPTPGSDNRSTRRIVTGGEPLTDPQRYYYTGDHYESFCLIDDVGGRS